VNEIDGNGKVVRLTDLEAVSPSSPLAEAPSPFQEPSAVQDSTGTQDKEPLKEDSAAAAEAPEVASSSAPIPQPDWAEELKGFTDILSEDACSAVLGFYQNIASFEAGRAGVCAALLACRIACLPNVCCSRELSRGAQRVQPKGC
jgi:hypothetical protein